MSSLQGYSPIAAVEKSSIIHIPCPVCVAMLCDVTRPLTTYWLLDYESNKISLKEMLFKKLSASKSVFTIFLLCLHLIPIALTPLVLDIVVIALQRQYIQGMDRFFQRDPNTKPRVSAGEGREWGGVDICIATYELARRLLPDRIKTDGDGTLRGQRYGCRSAYALGIYTS